MSAARRKSARAPDPGTVCRELCAAAAQGELPPLLLLTAPVRGEEEPWFGERILSQVREWARAQSDLDLMDCDGGSPDFDSTSVEAFLGAPGLFGGERLLVFGRATKALQKAPALAPALAQAAARADGPRAIVIQAGGSGASKAVQALTAAKVGRVERFRRLYADPPPWRPHDQDASEAAGFVQAEAAARGLRFAAGAAGALVQLAGGRPGALVQSLEHFELLGLEGIGVEQVREVAAHAAEGSAFDYAEAVLDGDGRRALRCLQQLRWRGLRTWDGKRLGPRDAYSMVFAVTSKQRSQLAAVRAALDAGGDFSAACKGAGLPAGGPPAQRMRTRLDRCDGEHLDRVLHALHQAERHLKVEGWSRGLAVLEQLAVSCHRSPRRA